MVTANPLPNPGSSSVNPDLNWSQVRETISLLCLAMAQVETTLNDSNKDVSKLTDAFTHIAHDAQKLGVACSKLENPDDFKEAKPEIMEMAGEISKEMGMAIVAFQFYDRLSQKLGHVNDALTHLGDLISDSSRLYNPEEWLVIQDEIKTNYTMECERIMFDLIMKGSTIKEALELYRHEFDQMDIQKDLDDGTDDDIELF
ncbi:hypothetical protein A9Q99_20640 [Gammaproteobacteria bacterium 45_16_T64]|nr:hypothetical protein A9Q99_20640 [Gammaproteobacteria bacterium 45_16_T64]